jgi:hypothetical protein
VWIPVEERLPTKDDDFYLVATRKGNVWVAEFEDGEFWDLGCQCEADATRVDATHWMPLPAPPLRGSSV